MLKHFRASVTFQYPEEPRPLATRFRSRHRLTVRDEGTPRCVGCMLCETVCPAKCITIVAGEPAPNTPWLHPGGDIECTSRMARWTVPSPQNTPYSATPSVLANKM